MYLNTMQTLDLLVTRLIAETARQRQCDPATARALVELRSQALISYVLDTGACYGPTPAGFRRWLVSEPWFTHQQCHV